MTTKFERLSEKLPDVYNSSPEVTEFQDALQFWADRMNTDKDDLLAQMHVDTATWGLAFWERGLGLETDISKPYSFRRTRIKSKLRGFGTTTKELIQNVAAAFSNGAVEVTEHNDESYFEVTFSGSVGIPPNMDDLTAAINEIKPAHLDFFYVYIYRTWAMVSHLKWSEVAQYTWAQLREGSI